MRPRDLPPASRYKHGTRARYVAGCRCRPCTHSNTVAYHERMALAKEAALELGAERTESHCVGINDEPCPHGTKLRKDSTGNVCNKCRSKLVWNGLVDAKPARDHLKVLSNAGVGYKSVADAACISYTVMSKIMSGKKTTIRANTEKAILGVDTGAMADHGLVDAQPVWTMVRRLIRTHGYTRGQISKKIGQGGRALQLGKKRVTARNAMKILKLLRDADGDSLRGYR